MAIGEVDGQLDRYDNLDVSASIGLAAWLSGETLDDALQRSDAACYNAKKPGRNRVRCAA